MGGVDKGSRVDLGGEEGEYDENTVYETQNFF